MERGSCFVVGRSKQIWSQLSWSELSGSVGDLGTFIPIFIALTQTKKIQPTPVLFWAGLANVITGFIWDVPMPVQPMKSIATTALLDQLSAEQVKASGILMGILLLLLTPFIDWVNRIVPHAVVAGLQIGVGLSLSIKGLHLLDGMSWFGPEVDCLVLAVVSASTAFYLLRENPQSNPIISADEERTDTSTRRRSLCMRSPAPVGLYLFGLATCIAAFQFQPKAWVWRPIVDLHWQVSSSDWLTALIRGSLPQLPLTTLNSVISVCSLANTLYQDKPRNSNGEVIAKTQVCWSVALLNLFFCPMGGLPVCHGAGGLAGQHRFGARHGTSVVVLGLFKMMISLCLGNWLLEWISAIPNAILSVLLVLAGLELAVTGMQSMSSEPKSGQTAALVTTICSLGWHATHYGALAGWIVHFLLREADQGVEYAPVRNEESSPPIAVHDESTLDTTNCDSALVPLSITREEFEG